MNKVTSDEKRWRTESDLDTLIRAAEIRKDKERFAAAKALAKKRYAAMKAADIC